MRIILITVLLTTLPACSFLKDWVTGSTAIWRDNTPPTTHATAEAYTPPQEVTVYEYRPPAPLIRYGPTLAESTVLGEGYRFPRWVKVRRYATREERP